MDVFAGQAIDGVYAQMFVEEYNDIIGNLQISNGEVVYDVVDSYQSLLDLVTK